MADIHLHRQTLGVDGSASAPEIKKAFRKRALAAHPDKGGSAEAFCEVVEAFEALLAPGGPGDEEHPAGRRRQPTHRRGGPWWTSSPSTPSGFTRPAGSGLRPEEEAARPQSAPEDFGDFGFFGGSRGVGPSRLRESRSQPTIRRRSGKLRVGDFDFLVVRTGKKAEGSLQKHQPLPPPRPSAAWSRPATPPNGRVWQPRPNTPASTTVSPKEARPETPTAVAAGAGRRSPNSSGAFIWRPSSRAGSFSAATTSDWLL
eukprot:TRINITY_DN29313_c0_g1_i1.p1 TRINITY_DN29313_c0_g1~~TRINITY_DN29313_c0_g1_i1.p1  ORF type:complete len:258 (-),score=37.19 TRINITY_DN29313_c0_g1_i1:129-902(-)